MPAHTLVMRESALCTRESALQMRIDALELRLYGGYKRSPSCRRTLETRLAAAQTSLLEAQARLAILRDRSQEKANPARARA